MFLGGVIVALSFMVSVCANEKFFYTRFNKALGLTSILILVLFWLGLNINLSSRFSLRNLVVPLYQLEGCAGFVLLILVLVLCLISVVNIRKVESGPLVKRL